MTQVIYVVVDKDGGSPSKLAGWKDARKLLVYTTESRARAAMRSRSVSEEDYEVVEYTPKGSD